MFIDSLPSCAMDASVRADQEQKWKAKLLRLEEHVERWTRWADWLEKEAK